MGLNSWADSYISEMSWVDHQSISGTFDLMSSFNLLINSVKKEEKKKPTPNPANHFFSFFLSHNNPKSPHIVVIHLMHFRGVTSSSDIQTHFF